MSMTDRELLERAAKAAGADWVVEEDGRFEVLSEIGGFSGYWKLLTDVGDALRLSVKLNLLWDRNVHYTKFLDLSDQGLLAATRCAIVRAAAEMAKED